MNLRKQNNVKTVFADSKKPELEKPQADDLHLGAYWDHNKQGSNLGQDKGDEFEFDKKPFGVRVVGIPNIETIHIARSWNIDEIKFILAKESGIKHDDIDLYFGGEKLVGEMIVFNCAILPDSIISTVLHSRI